MVSGTLAAFTDFGSRSCSEPRLRCCLADGVPAFPGVIIPQIDMDYVKQACVIIADHLKPELVEKTKKHQLESIVYALAHCISQSSRPERVPFFLADDPGTGKTRSTLILFEALKHVRVDDSPGFGCLLVIKSGTYEQWAQEVRALQALGLTLDIMHQGDYKFAGIMNISANDIVAVHYSQFASAKQAARYQGKRPHHDLDNRPSVPEWIRRHQFRLLAFDESHSGRNAETFLSKGLSLVNTDFMVNVSATPIQNGEKDVVNTAAIFAKDPVTAEKVQKTAMVRHPRTSCDPESMPPAANVVTYVKPFRTEIERTAYEMVATAHEKGGMRTKVAYITKELMVCGSPNYAKNLQQTIADFPSISVAPTKLNMVFECYDQYIREAGRKKRTAIVFSRWADEVNAIVEAAIARGLSVRKFEGKMGMVERNRVTRNLDAGSLDMLVVSLMAGYASFNWQLRSSLVIMTTPSFNPMIDYQAVCRVLRMGQTEKVTVVRMAIQDTIEERILDVVQLDKLSTINEFMQDEDMKHTLRNQKKADDQVMVDDVFERIRGASTSA
jgi:hypothetical protein